MKRALLIATGLLVAGAATWALWPEVEVTPPATETATPPVRSLAEQLEAGGDDDASDGGRAAVVGTVINEGQLPVAGATVTVHHATSHSLSAANCPVCGQPVFECTDLHNARELVALARAGKGQSKVVATTTTGADGSFRFEDLPQEALELEARLGDQATWLEVDPDGPNPMMIGPLQRLKLKVTRSAGNQEGESASPPISGAAVTAISLNSLRLVEGFTDGSGHLKLDGLDEGAGVWVLIEAPGLVPYVGTVVAPNAVDPEDTELMLEPAKALMVKTSIGGKPADALVTITTNGLGHARSEKTVGGRARFDGLGGEELEAFASTEKMISPKQTVSLEGELTTVEFELRASAKLLVTVIDESGQPVLNADVSVSNREGDYHSENTNQGDLVVIGPMGEGNLTVDVSSEQFRPWHREIDAHPGDNPLEVVLKTGVKLKGKVVDAEGKPVVQAMVEARAPASDPTTGYSDTDGNFELTFDEPGGQELTASQVSLGRAVVALTAPAEGVVIRLEPKARLVVHAREGRASVSGAMVSLEGGGSGEGRSNAMTDDEGTATLSGLETGDYVLMVQHGDFRQMPAKPVHLIEGRTTTVEFELDRGVTVTGTVVSATGAPVQGANVRTEPWTSSAQSDERGQFTLSTLDPAGEYKLQAESEAELSAPVTIKGPQASGVRLVMAARPVLSGRVVDDTGVPLQRFEVDSRSIESPDGRFSVPVNVNEADQSALLEFTATGFEALTWQEKVTASRDLGTVKLQKAHELQGLVRDARGAPVAGAVVTCDLAFDEVTTSADGSFRMMLSRSEAGATVTARRGQLRGTVPVVIGRTAEIALAAPTKVQGQVVDGDGRPVAGGVTIRNSEQDDEVRADAAADGTFNVDLAPGRWIFLTRLNAAGQSFQISGPTARVVLGTPPGSCAISVTAPLPPDELLLLPGDAAPAAEAQFDQLAAVEGAVVFDTLNATRVMKAAGFRCGSYTLLARWGGEQRVQRIDVRSGPNELQLQAPNARAVLQTGAP